MILPKDIALAMIEDGFTVHATYHFADGVPAIQIGFKKGDDPFPGATAQVAAYIASDEVVAISDVAYKFDVGMSVVTFALAKPAQNASQE